MSAPEVAAGVSLSDVRSMVRTILSTVTLSTSFEASRQCRGRPFDNKQVPSSTGEGMSAKVLSAYGRRRCASAASPSAASVPTGGRDAAGAAAVHDDV